MSPLRRRGGDLIFDTMFPSSSPAQKLNVEAVSGICGSISIACWVVVFSPQIIENFRRQNADGLSLLFLTIWLIGDVFNILGSVLQNVLPTMIILAVYYTLADIVLLLQCLYYRGLLPYFTKHGIAHPHDASAATSGGEGRNSSENNDAVESSRERSPLLNNSNQEDELRHRRRSFRERIASFDGAHLSPTVPMVEPPKVEEAPRRAPATTFQKVIFNTFAIALVCLAGFLGWYISSGPVSSRRHPDDGAQFHDELKLDVLGQVFGYLCTALYLGSRVPQLLLNYHRKSTEGISLLFFLFACIGNLTFVLSIFAYVPVCEGQLRNPSRGDDAQQQQEQLCRPGEKMHVYGRYLLVNAPWLLGSMGNLLQDMFIFVQFIMYTKNESEEVRQGESQRLGGRGSDVAVSEPEA